jgi:hypothetical protein
MIYKGVVKVKEVCVDISIVVRVVVIALNRDNKEIVWTSRPPSASGVKVVL